MTTAAAYPDVAAELAALAPLAPDATTAHARFGTLPGTLICQGPGCHRPLPEPERQHGSARLYCSPACRKRAWRAARRRTCSGAAA